tara:strand:+ start:456 stop:1124 length:669 start_codon:yes stop_codon:yes gene_type:complete
MKVWFDDPRQLVDEKYFLQFWPNSQQTPEDRINSASRFIVYASTLLYLIRRDPRVFILGVTILGVIYVLYKSKMVKESYGTAPVTGNNMCQKPTMDNPMGNVLMTDYTHAPNRLEACYYPSVKPYVQRYTSDRIPYDSGRSRTSMPQYLRNAMERQFVTMPVSKIPGGQTEFAEWLYGPKNGPMCKSDSKHCNPNARGVQLEAYSGLGGDGDIRGPRGGTYI